MPTGYVGPNGQWVTMTDVPAAAAGLGAPADTWANRALYQTVTGTEVRFSDVGAGTSDLGGGSLWYWTGTRMKPINENIILDAIDTANSGTASAAIQQLNPLHADIPAGVIAGNDRLRARASFTRATAAETATVRFHFGPLGTTADPVIDTFTLAIGTLSFGGVWDYKRLSATSIQPLGSADRNAAYSSSSTSAAPASVAVSSMDSNAMYFSVSQQMSVGAEFITVQDYTLELWATDS